MLRYEIEAAIRTLGGSAQDIPESQKYFAAKINDMI